MSFKMKDWIRQRAAETAKKNDTSAPVEKRLRGKKSPKSDLDGLTEDQLDDLRAGTKENLTEKKLDKVRKGPSGKITEARLDESDSKLVKHRNPEAHSGNIGKLEEQRLAGKPTEQTKYEAASKSDSSFVVPEIKGKDGVRTAASGRRAGLRDVPFSR